MSKRHIPVLPSLHYMYVMVYQVQISQRLYLQLLIQQLIVRVRGIFGLGDCISGRTVMESSQLAGGKGEWTLAEGIQSQSVAPLPQCKTLREGFKTCPQVTLGCRAGMHQHQDVGRSESA